jgi:hypothetical protein
LLFVEWEWKEEMRNVFEAILEFGHDEDFAPVENDQFIPTAAPAGSTEKLDVLARRIREGLPLWHPDDRSDYSGLTGAVRPRE